MKRNHNSGYEDRIVLFLDILGWGELVEQTNNDPGIVGDLLEKTDLARRDSQRIRATKNQGEAPPNGYEVAHFSDTVVCSCHRNEEGIRWLLAKAIHLSNDFLGSDSLVVGGFLCRGAIVSGKLFHSGNVVFGPILLKAYKMESTLAIYPRILIAEDLIPDVKNLQDKMITVRQDADGLTFLDTISEELNSDSQLKQFKQAINNGLTQCKNDLRKQMKWMWLKKYFDDVTTPFRNEDVTTLDTGTSSTIVSPECST